MTRHSDEAHQVGDDHHPLAPQAVGPDAADQREQHHGQREGGQHDADVGARVVQVENAEGERHGEQAVAQQRHGLTDEQVAEVAQSQHVEAGGQSHEGSLSRAAARAAAADPTTLVGRR